MTTTTPTPPNPDDETPADDPAIAVWDCYAQGPIRRYKSRGKGPAKKPRCCCCFPKSVAGEEVPIGCGITIVLCLEHRDVRFIQSRGGRDFLAAVATMFDSFGLKGTRYHVALTRFVNKVRDRNVPTPRRRPGSYAYPELRNRRREGLGRRRRLQRRRTGRLPRLPRPQVPRPHQTTKHPNRPTLVARMPLDRPPTRRRTTTAPTRTDRPRRQPRQEDPDQTKRPRRRTRPRRPLVQRTTPTTLTAPPRRSSPITATQHDPAPRRSTIVAALPHGPVHPAAATPSRQPRAARAKPPPTTRANRNQRPTPRRNEL